MTGLFCRIFGHKWVNNETTQGCARQGCTAKISTPQEEPLTKRQLRRQRGKEKDNDEEPPLPSFNLPKPILGLQVGDHVEWECEYQKQEVTIDGELHKSRPHFTVRGTITEFYESTIGSKRKALLARINVTSPGNYFLLKHRKTTSIDIKKLKKIEATPYG